MLAVEDGATDLDNENIPLPETIIQCCNGLVGIDNETSGVRLVHYSLEEFFNLHSSDYFPDGHKEIAHTCLTYLNFTPLLAHCETKSELEQLLMSYHLLEYSASQWGYHAVQQFDKVLEPFALRCLDLRKPTSAIQYCFGSRTILDQNPESETPYRGWITGHGSFSLYNWRNWDWSSMNTIGMAFFVAVAF